MSYQSERVIDAFAEFRRAAYNLNQQWQLHEEQTEAGQFQLNYPFPSDFNELTHSIEAWVNTSCNHLRYAHRYAEIAEQLRNTDGFVHVQTSDANGFLTGFHTANPFMKIELERVVSNRYKIIVLSGG